MSLQVRLLLVALALVGTMSAAGAAAASINYVPLADPELAASERGRMSLKYLASCALDADTVLVGGADGQRYEWPGSMALAPDWHRRGLTEQEERWVSACILARTNYFGVRVLLSLRSQFPSNARGLEVDAEEARNYPVEEATFFGNIFHPQGGAYVCANNDKSERKTHLAAHRRLCALPLDQRLADGRQVTACGFIYVGACTSEMFTQGGVTYQQAVTVFLPASSSGIEKE